jgi:FkbM family methyltransferase
MGVVQASKAALLRKPVFLGAVVSAMHPRYRITSRRGRYRVRRGSDVVLLDYKHAAYLPDLVANFDLMTTAVRPATGDGRRTWDFTTAEPMVLSDGSVWRFPGLPEVEATNAHYINTLGVRPGDVVWDVGAYSGLSTRAFSRAVGEAGCVVAIEADPACWACVTFNVMDLPNVELVNAALWDEAGTVDFQAEGNQGSTVVAAGSRTSNVVTVEAVTPAELLARTGGRLDVVKMDIEGGEYRVLPAFESVLERVQPRFLIETHRATNGRVEANRLLEFFRSHGYEATAISQPERSPFPLIHAAPIAC